MSSEILDTNELNAEFDRMVAEEAAAVKPAPNLPVKFDPGQPPAPPTTMTAVQKRVNGAKRKRQVAFLKAFAECGIVSMACKKADINPLTERRWRDVNDEWYNMRFREAYQEFRDTIEFAVHDRAINGVEQPIVGKRNIEIGKDVDGNPIFGQQDEIIGTKTVKSDLLLMFHAKRHIQEYKEKYEPQENEITKPQQNDSPLSRITLRIEMIAERQKQSQLRNVSPQLQIAPGETIEITPLVEDGGVGETLEQLESGRNG